MRLAGCLAAVVAVAGAGLALGALAPLAGCYAPNAATGAPCDLAVNNCPSNQTCMQTPDGSFCLSSPNHDGVDAPTNDVPPDLAANCYGMGLLTVCSVTPTGDVMVTTDRVIDTSMVGGTNCESIMAMPSGGSMCLITAQTFELASTAKLSATGPNPLVIVATDTLRIAGTLDVSSHVGATERGAGAQATCGSSSIAGGNGGGNMQEGAGGGGAGGSFGSVGGGGGTGHNGSGGNGGGAAGMPAAAMTPTKLLGGCPGGAGGPAGGGGGNGPGGNGGGAIYLIAGTTLEVTGAIDASGAGGGAGLDGLNASGGAGGGGTGGMIVLDAPTQTVSGSVFANGGGGGGGGGNDPAFHGSPGSDPSAPAAAATGGAGGQGGGGTGGNGFAAGLAATRGNNGSSLYTGGGGGGGGAGVIRTFGGTPTGGTFSPAPM